jgi:hypothetical protein
MVFLQDELTGLTWLVTSRSSVFDKDAKGYIQVYCVPDEATMSLLETFAIK